MRSSIIDLEPSPRSGAGAFAGLAAAYAQYGFDLVRRRVPIRNEIRCRDKRADISFSWRAPHTPTLAAARIDRSAVTRREHPRRPDLSVTRPRERTRLRLKGKVERSHRINSDEFYRLLEGEVIDDANLFAGRVQQRDDHYNYDRPHGALSGQTPYLRLKQKARDPLS